MTASAAIDEVIHDDLAVLGRADAQQLPGLGALRVFAAPGRTVAAELRMLVLGRIYAARVARLASGATALAAVAAFVAVSWWCPDRDHSDSILSPWRHEMASVGLAMIVVALLAHVIGSWVGARWFEREPVRASVDRLDGSSLVLTIAGTVAMATVLGVLGFAVGVHGMWADLERGQYRLDRQIVHALVDVSLAIPAIVVASVFSTRGRVVRWLARPAATGGGVALGIVVLWIGCARDVGSLMYNKSTGEVPSHTLRAALTIGGALAVLIVVAGLALRRRAREEAQLAQGA